MKLTVSSKNGVWYDSGTLKYSNLGNLHEIPGFLGLAKSDLLDNTLIMPSVSMNFTEVSIKKDSLKKVKEIGDKILDLLSSNYDYEASIDSTGNIESLTLKPGILRSCIVLDDMSVDKFDLFTQLSPIPESDINVNDALNNPNRLGTQEYNSSIIKKYILSSESDESIPVPISELKYIAKISRHDLNGNYLGSFLVTGDFSDRFIEPEKVPSEIRSITHITFRYVPSN